MVNEEQNNIDNEEYNAGLIREDLYKTEWVQEAKEILDIVTSDEQLVLLRCINHVEPTSDEILEVEKILGRYRDALREQKPTETLENVDNNILLVQSEKQFLDLLKDSRDKTVHELTMYYPVTEGKEVKIELEVYPLTDSSAILDVQSNLNLFKDFTVEEQQIYTDYQAGKNQSREDIAVAKMLSEKINNKIQENSIEIMIEYLAYQTNLKGFEHNIDYMREVYQSMNISFLALLMTKVQNIIGNVNDIDVEKVFRTSD